MGIEGKPEQEEVDSTLEQGSENAPTFHTEQEWKEDYAASLSYYAKNKATLIEDNKEALQSGAVTFEDVLEREAVAMADWKYKMKMKQRELEAAAARKKKIARADALRKLDEQIAHGDPNTAHYAERAKKLLEEEDGD